MFGFGVISNLSNFNLLTFFVVNFLTLVVEFQLFIKAKLNDLFMYMSENFPKLDGLSVIFKVDKSFFGHNQKYRLKKNVGLFK